MVNLISENIVKIKSGIPEDVVIVAASKTRTADEIKQAILAQLAHGSYPSSDIYRKPDTSKTIVEIIRQTPLSRQKIFFEL